MLRAPELLIWGRGTGSGGSAPLGAGRRARRVSSSPRRPPSPLLPDSVPGTALRDGAGLPLPFPLLPPPQTEDAPRRLEACVSRGARESGLGWGALATPRACEWECECTRAPTGWGSRERWGTEVQMLAGTEAEFFAPRKSVNPGKEARTRVSPGGAARLAAAAAAEKAARAGSGSERG